MFRWRAGDRQAKYHRLSIPSPGNFLRHSRRSCPPIRIRQFPGWLPHCDEKRRVPPRCVRFPIRKSVAASALQAACPLRGAQSFSQPSPSAGRRRRSESAHCLPQPEPRPGKRKDTGAGLAPLREGTSPAVFLSCCNQETQNAQVFWLYKRIDRSERHTRCEFALCERNQLDEGKHPASWGRWAVFQASIYYSVKAFAGVQVPHLLPATCGIAARSIEAMRSVEWRGICRSLPRESPSTSLPVLQRAVKAQYADRSSVESTSWRKSNGRARKCRWTKCFAPPKWIAGSQWATAVRPRGSRRQKEGCSEEQKSPPRSKLRQHGKQETKSTPQRK